MLDSILERYALAYIKENGSDSNVQRFLQSKHVRNAINWCNKDFEDAYKEFKLTNSTSEQDGMEYAGESIRKQTADPKIIHIHGSSGGLGFWDYFLLHSLFTGSTTVINGLSSCSTKQLSRENKKKDVEDKRKLLALGIVALVVCSTFHVLMCIWYNSSRKMSKKSKELDYLNNKLKMFRNVEFIISAISLVALVVCAISPILSVWGLVILVVNSLVCLAGSMAFHVKHEKELENIKKAKEAVVNYHESGHGYDLGDFSYRDSPNLCFHQESDTDPVISPEEMFYDPYPEEYLEVYGQQASRSRG